MKLFRVLISVIFINIVLLLFANQTFAQTVTLSPTYTYKGILRDGSGNPIASAAVELHNNTADSTVTTGSDGSFSLSVPQGTYTLHIFNISELDTNGIDTPNVTVTGDMTQDLTIPTQILTVKVIDPSGQAVQNAKVFLIINNSSNVQPFTVYPGASNATLENSLDSPAMYTGASGAVAIPFLPSSNVQVEVIPPSGSNLSITTETISFSGTSSISLQLTNSTYTYKGILRDGSGNPIASAAVELHNNSVDSTVTTGSDGSFSLSIPQGTYTLHIFNIPELDTLGIDTFNVTVTGDTTQDLTIPTQLLGITVLDPSNHPISNAHIIVFVNNPSVILPFTIYPGASNATVENHLDSAVYTSDSSGFVNIPYLPSTTVTMEITPPNDLNLYTKYQTFSFPSAENITISYEAAPVTTANLTTQYADGKYTDPTTVTLATTAASGYTVANTYYTIDGGSQQAYSAPFTVTGEGSHTIMYWSVDNSGVQEATNTKTFTITEAHKLTGTVYNDNNQNGNMDSGEQGYPGATVTLYSGPTVVATATTDSSGVYTFNNIEEGTYTETLTVPNGYFTTTTNPVNVPLSTDTTVNFGITHTAPTTTASLSPAPFPDGTYADPTTVTLAATAEAGFTVANTYYTIDGGAQQTYSAPFTVTGNGSHTITYWSEDNTGLQETPHTKTFIIASYTLSGTVYNDDNQNGIQELPGEAGVSGAIVTLSSGPTVIGTAITGADGSYSFKNLQPGTYTDTLTVPNGYSPTTTNPATVAVSADTTQNFGIFSKPNVSAVTVNPNPVQINTAVTATATFTDADATDTHTATINWDVQGNTITSNTCQITAEPNGSTPGSVSCSLPAGYSAANIYSVAITVSDNDGNQGQATNSFVSVYAPTPNGRFAAGQAYITPSGAYAQNTNLLTSLVSIGLSYKYSGTMPSEQKQLVMTFGNTNITFSATAITSLVISNGIGTMTGTGTLSNASTVYNFLVTGDQNTNTIRIKITDPNNSNAVIYDTQNGAADTATPTTSVTGPQGQAGHGSVIAN